MNLLTANGAKHALYMASMGKLFRVTGIFTSDDDANARLSKPRNGQHGVIAAADGLVFTANLYSRGSPEACKLLRERK